MLHADLHMHSHYSKDSKTKFDQLIKACEAKGINCVALTDHGHIEGAFELAKVAPFKVIIGEEIHTDKGEVIGLFIKERIEPHGTLNDAVRQIKEQGGLVYVPHPFDRIRKSHMDYSEFIRLLKRGDVDIVEGLNARTTLPIDNKRAVQAANKYGVAIGAGSDAHSTYEVGNAYVELEDFETKEEFLANLRKGRVCGNISPMWVHFFSIWARNSKKFGLK